MSLFLTLIITRILTYRFHDFKGYGQNDKSKTITGFIRRKFHVDIHHFHFGILILIICLILIYLFGINNILIVFLGISISFIADQVIPIFNRQKCYFAKEQLLWSITFHVLIAIITLNITKTF